MMDHINNLKAKWLNLDPKSRMLCILLIMGIPAYFLADVLMPKAPEESTKVVRQRNKPVFMSNSGSQRLETTQTLGQLEAMKKEIQDREKRIDAQYNDQQSDVDKLRVQIDKQQIYQQKSNQLLGDLQRQVNVLTDKLMRAEAKASANAATGKDSGYAGPQNMPLNPTAMDNTDILTSMPTLPAKALTMNRGDIKLKPKEVKTAAADTPQGNTGSANAKTASKAKAAISQSHNVNTKPKTKEPETWISAGTVIPTTLLTGHHVPTSSDAKNDPLPVLLKIVDIAEMPNGYTIDLRGCTIVGAAKGNASTRRVEIRAESISCIDTQGRAIEQPLLAAAQGPDGQGGIPAKLVTLYGESVKQSFWAGMYGAGAQTLSSAASQRTSGSQIYASDYLMNAGNTAVAGGVSKSFDRISEFYLNLAEEARPYLEMPGGVEGVDLIVQRGTAIKYKG